MADTSPSTKPGLLGRYLRLPRNVLALSLVALLNDTSSDIIYPLLPAFLAITLGASPFAIGLIEGFAESVASVLKLFSGYLSDRFNSRKWPVLFGYSFAAVMRPLLALVTTWPQVLFLRTADRMGKGVRGAPRDALIASSVPESERGFAFGFNRAADNFGAVLGPIAAFLLLSVIAVDDSNPTAHEYQQVFLFASIPVLLALAVIIFFVRDMPHRAGENHSPVKLSLKGFDANFKRLLLIIALFTLSNSTDAFLLLRAKETGISAALLPILWMVLQLSKVGFSLVGGDLSDRIGRRKLIVAGWLIYAAVYVAFAFVDSAWQVWALFLIYGVYFGFTEGVEKALVADLSGEERRGTAFGLYNLAYGITVFPASVIFGLLYSIGAEAAFLTSAAISVTAALLLMTVRVKRVA